MAPRACNCMARLQVHLPGMHFSMSAWALLLRLRILLMILLVAAREEPLTPPHDPGNSSTSWRCGAGDSRCLGSVPERVLFLPLLHFTGTKTMDYLWDSPGSGQWLQARADAKRESASYAVLSHSMYAEPYWGRRVMLQGFVSVRGLTGGAFGALAVQVINGNGRTVAFDNMRDRPIVGSEWTEAWHWVVLNVPGPPPDGSCPLEGSLPLLIHVGFLLCGGRGFIAVDKVTFDVVGESMAVTNGPPPWVPPRII